MSERDELFEKMARMVERELQFKAKLVAAVTSQANANGSQENTIVSQAAMIASQAAIMESQVTTIESLAAALARVTSNNTNTDDD